MTTATSPVIERVKKLLALSNSDVPAERDAALAKANALIAEHRIDMVLLQGDTVKPEAFDEIDVDCGRRMPVEIKFVGWLLEKHFRCEIIYKTRIVDGRVVRKFTVLGRQSDAEFGRWLVGYLVEEFRRRWKYYRASRPNVPLREKNTFIYGMYKGLDARLAEEAKAAEDVRLSSIASAQLVPTTCDAGNAPQTADQLRGRYTLALQDESARLASELSRRYPRLRSSSTRLRVNHTSGAMADGMSHGRTISTNRPLAAAT